MEKEKEFATKKKKKGTMLYSWENGSRNEARKKVAVAMLDFSSRPMHMTRVDHAFL